ncbi:MAG: CoA transferase [Chloroflexota bacterium]|nr:CoA transferase [Chloroflexota bacterium]
MASESSGGTDGALNDLRVVEYAQGVTGPFCGKAFADLGADVVKVEPPGGDRSRTHGPFPNDEPHPEKSGRFLYLNTNKRCITLNIEDEAGRELLRELAASADILIADLPPTAYGELELDYETLSAQNAGLIMVCTSPFGLTGPYRDYQGSAFTAFHIGGMGRETPYNEITDSEAFPPLVDGGDQADYLTGWTAATMALIAVFHRSTYGTGQLLDVSAMESVAGMTRMPIASIGYGQEPKISREKANFPWVMPCKDGHVSFAPFLMDHWWRAVVDMMGSPDWAVSEVFATTMGRVQNADVVEPLTVEWLMEHTKQEIYEMALARNVACFPVNTMEEVLNSRQYAARDFFVDVEHPKAGTQRQPGAAGIYSSTPWAVRRPAPLLGQHTREVVCGELGRSEEELAALAASGAVEEGSG